MIDNLSNSTHATELDRSYTAATNTSEVAAAASGAFATALAASKSDSAPAHAAKLAGAEAAPQARMDSAIGAAQIDLNKYFSQEPNGLRIKSIDDLPPLLLPSADNIKALKTHASSQLKQMLQDNSIPLAPEKISFDAAGEMLLPADYPYTRELRKAFEQNEGIHRELSTVNALSSHYVEMQVRTPFVEAMNNATSKAEIERVITQYNYLLQDNNNYISTALVLSSVGDVSVTADGEAVNFD